MKRTPTFSFGKRLKCHYDIYQMLHVKASKKLDRFEI